MDVAVMGGTGTVGREVVSELTSRGHRPIVLSRRPPREGSHEHRPVDLTTGEGLARALGGADTLVDVAQGGRDVLVDGLRGQFHQLLASAFKMAGRAKLLPLLRVPLQPVDPRDVARTLADRVEAGPSSSAEEIAGPRMERMDELARAWARAHGVRRLPLPVPAAGKTLRAVRLGGLTDERALRGTITFADWLEEETA